MRTIDLTDKSTFALTNPETGEQKTFLGHQSESRQGYLAYLDQNPDRDPTKTFFDYCIIYIPYKEK